MWLNLTVLRHGVSSKDVQLINMDHVLRIEAMGDRTRLVVDDGSIIEVAENVPYIDKMLNQRKDGE